MTYPATLIEHLRRRKIVPFIGAGVSRAVRSKHDGTPLFPSWSELLHRAADKLGQESKSEYANLVRSLITIDKPDYLGAAKYAKDNLGANWFTFLKAQLDHPRSAAAEDSLALAQHIWRLGSNLVVTTNYDRVLAWACDKHEDLAFWNIESPAEQAAMMRSGLTRPVIWHLHGMIDDAAKIILTPDGYSRLYPTPHTEAIYVAAIQSLRSLLTSHSLLFVGFSFEDAAFGITLRAVRDVYAGANGPHYALIHRDNIDAARAANLAGVELIPFADFGQPLFDVIDDLVHTTDIAPPLSIQVPDQPTIMAASVSQPEPFDDTCDTPPPTGTWVGRASELDLLAHPDAKVVAITGIGGQGKSTLVAKYLEDAPKDQTLLDWRDCKEQDNTLHTHLVRIIERLTKGNRRASDLVSESIESVIRLFLNITISMQGIFVFDNIDHYVDVHTSQAVKGMHTLIQGALKSPGPSRFVFTTRPKLKYDSPSFMQIELRGLTIEEARMLFELRKVHVGPRDLEELHALLQGHPLWIGLIANQVHINRVKVPDLIARIESGKDAGLPNVMLREIWRGLKRRQQSLLRYLAELVRPETEKQLEAVVSRDFSKNQFRTTINHLKTLDLVIVKSPHNATDTIELHPLVREYVRRQFSGVERNRYIAAILVYFDRIILELRPALSRTATFETLQNWTAKVELLVNSDDYRQALTVLDEAAYSLLSSGYSEDFVRLAFRILSICDWSDSVTTGSTAFEKTFEHLVEVLSQLGRFEDAEVQLTQFEHTAAGATARYICVCRLRAYFYWSRREFDLAKEWGQRGVALKQSSNIDTRHDCSHDLALAQRDSGETASALKYFLHDAELASIVDPSRIDTARSGSFYGNIGRTLYFMGKYDDAMSCLLKSAWLLEREQRAVLINFGWASSWLGDMLEGKQDFTAAYICFRRASAKWKEISPYRADEALSAAQRLSSKVETGLVSADDSLIEHKYHVWLDDAKKF